MDEHSTSGAPTWLWSNVSLDGVPLVLPKSAEHLIIPKTGVLKARNAGRSPPGSQP